MKKFNNDLFERIAADAQAQLDREVSDAEHPDQINLNLLFEILQDNKDTEYGKKYHFSEISSFADYKKNVPITDYNDYASYVHKMFHNQEKDILTVYPIVHYSKSSGTTGVPKLIPLSVFDRMRHKFGLQCLFARIKEQLLIQNKKAGHIVSLYEMKKAKQENGVSVGSVSSQNLIDNLDELLTSPKAIQCPELDGSNSFYLKALFALMQKDVCAVMGTFSSIVYDFMREIEVSWKKLVKDIRFGTITGCLISDELYNELKPYLKADPQRAEELEKIFQENFAEPVITKIWPNFVLVNCIGGSFFKEYTLRLKKYIGEIPFNMGGYVSSEAIMGFPLFYNSSEYYIMPQNAFFEFIEAGKTDFENTLTLEQLEQGKDYEVILTTRSGLYRYRLYDVFRVTGHYNKAPLGTIPYRINQLVNMVGEKMNMGQIQSVIEQLAEKIGHNILEYSIYPDYSMGRAGYIFFIEPNVNLGKGSRPEYDTLLDEILCTVNSSFKFYRNNGTMGMPTLMIVEPETYKLFRDMQIMSGVPSTQIKPVRIIDNYIKKKFFFGMAEGSAATWKRLGKDTLNLNEKIKILSKENEELRKKNNELQEIIRNLSSKPDK